MLLVKTDFSSWQRPLDEDHYTAAEYNDDPRPNLWKKPGGNWARIEFNGLNIHHTNEKNWARGADFHVDGAVFSDNSRGWIHKGTSPTPGSTKSVTNSVFVGFTRNAGHKYCFNDVRGKGRQSTNTKKSKKVQKRVPSPSTKYRVALDMIPGRTKIQVEMNSKSRSTRA